MKINFPSSDQLRYTLRLMNPRERTWLLALVILAAVGFFGTLNKLNERFSVLVPETGGSITEGIVGSPHFVNPLLAIADPDRDVANLVYAALLRSDGKGNLVPELAERFEISPDGLSYTFFIRPGVIFHDGEAVGADDVIFTIETAKNPLLKSPVRAGWEGVEVEKVDERTVRFWLKRPYAPFLENATVGILPKHLWKDIPPEQMSLSELNSNPIGAGPFKISDVKTAKGEIVSTYTLRPFPDYVLGKPYLRKIILKFYPSEIELLNAYESREVNALSAVSPQNLKRISRRDEEIKTLNLPRVFGVFFNQNEKSIFIEKAVRQALELAVNKERIIEEVLGGYALKISSPIPPGSFGALKNEDASQNLEEAKKLLEKNGWKFNAEKNIYEKIEKNKAAKELAFSLATSNAPDLVRSADLLKADWEKLGARAEIKVFEIADLNQNVIRPRKYDALLFGEVVGRDPDPFAFWHSSQRNDPGLNIALYTSAKVDKILEEARSLISREERVEKYGEFQKEIQRDAPAIFLYSPSFIYILPSGLKSFETEHIVTPAERFTNIFRWHFNTRYVWKIFQKNQ